MGVKSEINDTVLLMAQQSARKLAKTTLEKLGEHVYNPELQLLRISCCLATGSNIYEKRTFKKKKKNI